MVQFQMPIAEISLVNLKPNPRLAGEVSGKLRATNLGQMVLMQEQLFADAMDLSIPAKDRAACARAYEVLEKRKRMNRGLPDPKPAEVTPKAKRKAIAPATPIEP